MSRVEHPEAFIAPQTGLATLVLGEPGITKTRTYEAFARHLGRRFEAITPSQREPADIVGYPAIIEIELTGLDGKKTKHKVAEFVPARWRLELENCREGGFVLFDEILDCTRAHQAAIQQILNDGIPNCLIAGCGNPADISTNGYELSAAVTNRLVVLDYTAPVDEWKINLATDFRDVPDRFPVLPADWKRFLPDARGAVLGFLNAQPQMAQKLPKQRSEQGKPWPSLRSWTNTATVLAAGRACAVGQRTTNRLVAGCVGKAAQQVFDKWVEDQDLPPITDVLDDPKVFNWRASGDRVYAVASALISYTLANLDKKTWTKACKVLEHGGEFNMAVCGGAAVQLCKCRPDEVNYPKRFLDMYLDLIRELLAPS